MSTEHTIFVGFELADPVGSLHEACPERDRVYLEDSAYLETVLIDGKTFVGKRVKGGVATDRIEDTARSVVSLLMRVSSEWKAPPNDALVIAVDSDAAGDPPDADGDNVDAADKFDYSGLVD